MPTEDTLSNLRAGDPETQAAVAGTLAEHHTPHQLLGLAQALIAQAMRPDQA